MSTCRDCISYDRCQKNYLMQVADLLNVDIDTLNKGRNKDKFHIDNDTVCEFFKAKSKNVELPCAIGSEIYIAVFCRNTKTKQLELRHFMVETVVGVHICDDRLRVNTRTKGMYRDYIITKTSGIERLNHIPVSKIGKTVFTSREEAEKALENIKNKGEMKNV